MEPIHSKLARSALGMTVRKVADVIDVNANTVARFEMGRLMPNAAQWKSSKICMKAKELYWRVSTK